MKPEDIKTGVKVINKKYGTVEVILDDETLMKDSQYGWIKAVTYYGPDRFKPGSFKTYCKNQTDFLNEFELASKQWTTNKN